MRIFIITGFSSGLGEKIVQKLNENNEFILGIGRTIPKSQNISNNFQILKCNFSNLNEVNNLLNNFNYILKNKFKKIIFINNAGIIEPIKKIGKFTENKEISKHINVNYISPIIIVNRLVELLNVNMNLQILNITSGAAEKPIQGWSLYCSSKKAIKSFLDILNKENSQVSVQHIDPGTMNTKMQSKIRESNTNDFPNVEQFRDYKNKNLLLDPEKVALKILERYIK